MGALVGGAHDKKQKECGQYHFSDQGGHERIIGRRMLAITVRGKTATCIKAHLAAGDKIKHRAGNDAAQYLCNDIRYKLTARKPPSGHQAERDSRIEYRKSVV